jgi:hypothetical protein
MSKPISNPFLEAVGMPVIRRWSYDRPKEDPGEPAPPSLAEQIKKQRLRGGRRGRGALSSPAGRLLPRKERDT